VILGRLGLAVAALAGYSAGAALAARGRRVVPRGIDLPLAFGGAVAAAALAPRLGWRAGVLATIAGAMLLGAVAGSVRPEVAPAASDAEDEPAGAWKRFARRMGNFQARLLLAAIYFTLVAPFALFSRLSADPLAAPTDGSRWRERRAAAADLDAARGQS
jgi:hypothetical protein